MVRPGTVSGNFAVSVCAFAERKGRALQDLSVSKSDLTRLKINWNDLRYVLAVGRAGTLSGAAVVILSGLYLFARERKAVGATKSGPAADIATQ